MIDDEPVTISQEKPLRLTADGMRALKKATGHTMSELLADDEDEANRIQVAAFAELHRRETRLGHMPDAATLWERAGALEVVLTGPEPIDPLGGGSSPASPPSVPIGT
jgi:hypothetical protein